MTATAEAPGSTGSPAGAALGAPGQRYSLVGHPVRHSVSPSMCMAGFAGLGLSHVYTAIDVPSVRGLPRVIEELRAGTLAGCNVTVPYKRAILQHVDALARSAEEVGAANVLVVEGGRIVAHNTDADALAQEIDAAWHDRPRHRAAIVGSGGAGLAAIIACRTLGFRVVCMTSRSWLDSQVMFDAPSSKRARALGALTVPWPHVGAHAERGRISQALRVQWFEHTSGADCVIQATSAGMLGADPGEEVSSVIPWQALPKHAFVYDVVYNPAITPFIEEARAHGLTASSGLGMLVRQGARAIALWTGREPPLDRMHSAASQALATALATGGRPDPGLGGR